MHHYRIALLPGDGIGKEIMPVAMDVLRAVATVTNSFQLETVSFPWGCEHYLETGVVMPKDGIQTLSQFDAIYFVAAGHPDVDDTLSGWEFIYQMRKQFKEYVCLRPIRSYEGIPTLLASDDPIDMVVVRENSEGEYAGAGGFAHVGFSNEVAVQTSVFTREGVERIARYAFELACKRRNHVTSVTKSNALQYTQVFWDRIVAEVAADYPGVQFDWLYADAATMKFVQNPGFFDVVVSTNLFGDLLSDLGGAIAGSIGLIPSGNINAEGDFPSMYEPVHGSAPDIAGKGIANPIAMILAGALMLDDLGETAGADIIRSAVTQSLKQGTRSRDLGGSYTTVEMGEAIKQQVLNGKA